jgi:hypothetical protein
VLEGALSSGQVADVRGTSVSLPIHALLLIAALAATVVAQGGFYLPGRILAVAIVGLALIAALRDRVPSSADGPPLVACAAVAGWAVVRAAIAGSFTAAIPVVASVFCLAGAMIVAARTDQAARAVCAAAAIGIGVLIAVTGWIAVVWRIPSWTTVADGLVRAASTLTYPNAAAALLACLAVLAISKQPRSLTGVGAAYLLLVGLGATLSRAGLLALAVGLLVLTLLAGPRATLRNLAPPAVGALVAVAALISAFPVISPVRPALPLLGLAAGFGISLALNRLRTKVLAIVLLAGLVLAGVALASRGGLITGRVGLSSPDRSGASGAALDLVASHPLFGVGPGQAWLSWTAADGHVRVARYIHNEYLQVLTELGAVGLTLLLCVLATIAITIRRGRKANPAWAGATAASVVLIVHSGFDFLWHIPAILLTAGTLIGFATNYPVAKEKS